MPLTHVQSLHVRGPPTSMVFWKHILGHFRGLRYLKISAGNMPKLASILSLDPDDDTGDLAGQANPRFAPGLERRESYSRQSRRYTLRRRSAPICHPSRTLCPHAQTLQFDARCLVVSRMHSMRIPKKRTIILPFGAMDSYVVSEHPCVLLRRVSLSTPELLNVRVVRYMSVREPQMRTDMKYRECL